MVQTGHTSSSYAVVFPTLAALLFLAAIVALVTAISLIFPGPAWIAMWNLNRPAWETFHRLGATAETLLLILALVAGTAAVGLLLHRRWAWWVTLFLFAANGMGDFVSLLRTRELLRFGSGVLIAAGFLWLLTRPSVRRTLY